MLAFTTPSEVMADIVVSNNVFFFFDLLIFTEGAEVQTKGKEIHIPQPWSAPSIG